MDFFKGYENSRISVQIQTTSVCTGKCIMCPYMESWHKSNPGYMTDIVFDKILEEISDFSIKKICPYLENEPLADHKIFERISKIRKKFPETVIEISTNASLLTKDKIKKLLDVLCEGPHDLWLSFHGVDKRTYEGIMGLSFEKNFFNIINLLRESKGRNLNLRIRGAGLGRESTLNHQYSFDQDTYKSFWESIFNIYNLKRKNFFPKIDCFTYHDRAGSIKRNSIHLNHIVRPSLENFNCVRLKEWLHFLYTGELILCCMDYHRETVFGDIRNQNLTEIFKGLRYENLGSSVTGLIESSCNFICKRCISPGG